MLAWSSVQAEVKEIYFSDTNRSMDVTNDDGWQPEGFKNGRPVPASYVKNVDINIDGIDDEPAWKAAEEVKLPLSYGHVTEATVKALYSDDEVFLRVRWADSTEDRDHRPWTWDDEQRRYVEGQQTEDSVLLSFEKGCDWHPSMLSGYQFDFDGWRWLAARSDPVGQAWDLSGTLGPMNNLLKPAVEYNSRYKENQWNLKFFDYREEQISYKDWDQLDRSYLIARGWPKIGYFPGLETLKKTEVVKSLPAPEAPPMEEGKTFPQFAAVKLEGDAGEVTAKGHWQDGYWTVEFRRIRWTPADNVTDVVFNRLTQFSIHVFDRTERLDEVSESERLFLQFLPSTSDGSHLARE
jgi:hypothetical protein